MPERPLSSIGSDIGTPINNQEPSNLEDMVSQNHHLLKQILGHGSQLVDQPKPIDLGESSDDDRSMSIKQSKKNMRK